MTRRTLSGNYDLSMPFLSVSSDTSGIFGPLLLRDEASATVLERHFNDLYHLFLNRFARLSHDADWNDQTVVELNALLNELLAAKKALVSEAEKL